MNDLDFRAVFFLTQEILESYGQNKKTYVVIQFKDEETDKWRFAEKVWEQRNAILIPMDCVDFLEELRDQVDDIITGRWISQLAKALSVGPKEIKSRINDRLKNCPGLTKHTALIAIAESCGYEFEKSF